MFPHERLLPNGMLRDFRSDLEYYIIGIAVLRAWNRAEAN